MQRTINPAETVQSEFGSLKHLHSQSLNRDKSWNMGLSFNKHLKRSTISRSSSTRSFVDRSHNKKEILSPFYKPFEIFFNYRKKSPYMSHRSNVKSN